MRKLVVILLLISSVVFAYETKTTRNIITDKNAIDLYLMTLKHGPAKVLDQMLLEGKIIRIPEDTPVEIKKCVKPLDQEGGGIYEVKVGKAKAYMIVTPSMLKEKEI